MMVWFFPVNWIQMVSVVGGRNIRLDILAKDSTGKNYNVEVQKVYFSEKKTIYNM